MKKFEDLKKSMESANNFLKNHVFEVYLNFTTDEDKVPTNVKVELTGIKNYISIGDNKPFVQFTTYILPTNKTSDLLYSALRTKHGREKHIKTFNYGGYESLGFVMQRKLSEFLKYFSLPDAILTKVVNEVEPMKLNENLIVEGRYDSIVRELVRDIVSFYKYQREGQFLLPEDLKGENFNSYKFPGINNEFVIELNLEIDDDVENVDIDAAYYREEDVIEITIISNPEMGYKNLELLIGELNETLRHELEHIYQYQKGYKFPKREPTSPIKYYLQPHELEAQRAGFKRIAKLQKKPLIDVITNWFNKNKKRHRLSDKEVEKVIKKILEIS
jgi:hypothetical protein